MSILKLYNLNGCGYCAMVRDVLEELGLDYETINVPWLRRLRTEVYKVSGQYTVPVLVDGETVLDDEHEIIDHLKKKYSNAR